MYSLYKVCLPKIQSTVSSGPTSHITANTNLKEDHSFILKENKWKVIAMLSCIIQTKSHVEDFWNVPCGLGSILRMKLRTAFWKHRPDSKNGSSNSVNYDLMNSCNFSRIAMPKNFWTRSAFRVGIKSAPATTAPEKHIRMGEYHPKPVWSWLECLPKLVFMRVSLTNGVIIHRCCKHKSGGYHQ